MYYEVFIPSGQATGTETRLQVQARGWRQAIEASARHGGVAIDSFENAWIELRKDGEREVTIPATRSRYLVRKLDEKDTRISQVLDATAVAASNPSAAGTSAPRASAPVQFRDSTGKHRTLTPSSVATVPDGAADEGRIISETVKRSAPVEVSPEEAAEQLDQPAHGQVSENALEDVFLEIPDIFEPGYTTEQAITFVVELAKKYIPCSQAGMLFPDDNHQNLFFAEAKGKGSKRILDAEVPIEGSLLGRCLREGFAFAVPNVSEDPRYNPAFTDATGIKVENLGCAPLLNGSRVFGIIALANREQLAEFSENDVNVLSYIGSQMGKFLQMQYDIDPNIG